MIIGSFSKMNTFKSKKIKLSRKIKKKRKISFNTSQTGKNLNKLRKSAVLKKRKMPFLEDEELIFPKGLHLLSKTISQKNDNDVDSEPEIIVLGVRFLHRKLLQSICKEKEILKSQNKVRKTKKAEMRKKDKKIQDYFSSQTFNTPSERRISVNDMTYLNSIISSQKKTKVKLTHNASGSTVMSNSSVFADSRNLSLIRPWGEGKHKRSKLTVNTDQTSLVQTNADRKHSSFIFSSELMKGSLGSMFTESPNFRKA